MSNQLGIFDPILYAQVGINQLYKSLGMARRVYRGYDKTPQQKGSTISIKMPSTFVAQDAPSTDQDINTDSINIKLSQWKEVKFKISDQELNYTQDELIRVHIAPAAYALADKIDSDLCTLANKIPWRTGTPATTPSAVSDITGVRRQLFNNKVPLTPGMIHLMVDGNAEEKFLQLAAFTQNQGAGNVGVDSQLTGSLGTRYGMEIFANQNVVTSSPGSMAATAPLVNGAQPIHANSVNIDGTSLVGTLKVGDILEFAGDSQKYAVVETPDTYNPTQTYTASGNALNGIFIYPHLQQALADNTAVTITQTAAAVQNIAFHENFAALAFAPLTDMANALGAQVATITDPVTGLALRSRVWYEGNMSSIRVALDVLYGFRVLDANKAAILLG